MASPRTVRRRVKAPHRRPGDGRALEDAVRDLITAGRRFDARGWVLGTSGNFSTVLSREPLRLAITASGGFKGELNANRILDIDGDTLAVKTGTGRPSAETPLHVEIVRARDAGAVLHTHSVWSTVLSEATRRMAVSPSTGYEMLKGLEGVTTHEHREWMPILDNDQDMDRWLARGPARARGEHPACHAFPAPAARVVHLGRHAAAGRAARRDPRVPARSDRPSTAEENDVMAIVRIPDRKRQC